MRRIFFIIPIIFCVLFATSKADNNIDITKISLENSKEMLYLLEKLNKAVEKGNAWEIRDLMELDARAGNKKDLSEYSLKILKNIDYSILYSMIISEDFNEKFLKNNKNKIYEELLNDTNISTSSSLVLTKYTDESYNLTILRIDKQNLYSEVNKISFEIKKKGKKYKISRVGIFTS